MTKSTEQELVNIACGKRSAEDQALWDRVAIAAFAHEDRYSIGACFDIADDFMAERAKRMKGGV